MEDKEYQGKDVSVSQRQIYILSLLSENPRGYLAEEIQQRLTSWDIHVSKRTITRDIDELSLNYGICEEERGGKNYFYADKYTLKNVDLTIEDLVSLAFAKEIVKGYQHLDMGKHAVAFIDKMVEQSAALNLKQFEKMGTMFAQSGNKNSVQDDVDVAIEKSIQNAIDNRNKIEISYYSFSSDESSKRVIHPYKLMMIDAYLCVEAYCELREEVRRFRLARIKSLKVLDEKYKESELEANANSAFLQLNGGKNEDLELVFYGDAIRYVKEYEKSRAKEIRDLPDGLHFYQTLSIAPDVIRWIRGFGSDVEVIKPVWLRKQLLEEAEQIVMRK